MIRFVSCFLFALTAYRARMATAEVETTIGSVLLKEKELFQKFTTAIEKTDALLDQLNNPMRKWTAFVPVNEVFDSAIHMTSFDKLKLFDDDTWSQHRQSWISYHLVPFVLSDTDFDNQVHIPSLEGTEIHLNTSDTGSKTVNGDAEIVRTFDTFNGKIYAIDGVPRHRPALDSIATVLGQAESFQSFAGLTQSTDDDLDLDGSHFTVFVPTNEAFSTDLEYFLNDILKYHAVPDINLYSSDLLPGQTFPTSLVGDVDAAKQQHLITISETGVNSHAAVLIDNMLCTNGVIHVIDTVLMPTKEQVVDELEEGDETTEQVVDEPANEEGDETTERVVDEAVNQGTTSLIEGEPNEDEKMPPSSGTSTSKSLVLGIVALFWCLKALPL